MTNNYIEDNIRDEVIKFSLEQRNKKYIHGKHGPDSFDCAGFVWYVYNSLLDIDIYKNGIGLSTTTMIMTSTYGKITLYDEKALHKNLNLIKDGDILLFHRQALEDNSPSKNNKYPGHCGISIGNNSFIHCSSTKGKVLINNFLDNDYWQRVLVASKDIITDNKCYILKK